MRLLRTYVVGLVALPVVLVALFCCLPFLAVDDQRAFAVVDRLQEWFTKLAKGGAQ